MSLRRPPVRRCLFGRPASDDDFLHTIRLKDTDAKQCFEAKWNFNISSNEDIIDGQDYKWIKIHKSASDSAIPDFYTRGYSNKSGRRACSGKRHGDDEDGHRPPSPVQYQDRSSVELYLGVSVSSHHHHYQESPQRREPPVTPPRSCSSCEHQQRSPCALTTSVTTTTDTSNTSQSSAVVAATVVSSALASDEGVSSSLSTSGSVVSSSSCSPSSPSSMMNAPGVKHQQQSLPGYWPIRKRARSLTADEQVSKREKIDGL